MSASELRTLEVARALWGLAERDAVPQGDVQAVADLLFTSLEAGLRRWIGAEGYASLLSRSMADALPAHPALLAIQDLSAEPIDGTMPPLVSEAAGREAVIALLATMMRQLGGIIGEAMAIRLIELSGTPTPRGTAGPEANDLS